MTRVINGWLVSLLCVACVPAPPPAPLATPEASPAPPPAAVEGFGYRELELPGATTAPLRLAVATADPARVQLAVSAAKEHPSGWRTAEIVAAQTGALAVINGGYFDQQDRPLGLLIAGGETLNPWRDNGWPAFVVTDAGPRLVTGQAAAAGAEEALQSGPWLVREGQPTRLKESEPAERSAVGLNGADEVLFIATRRGRLTLAEFAAVLARPEDEGGLGCASAINLDGGASTQMAVPGEVQIRGLYAMPSHLMMLPKAPR